jgi:hypothetical protein
MGCTIIMNNEQHKLKYDSLSCPPFAISTLQVPISNRIGVVTTQAKSVCRDISTRNLVIETRAVVKVPICQFKSRGGVWNLSTLLYFMTHDSQTGRPVFLLFVTCVSMLVMRSQVVNVYRQSCTSQLILCDDTVSCSCQHDQRCCWLRARRGRHPAVGWLSACSSSTDRCRYAIVDAMVTLQTAMRLTRAHAKARFAQCLCLLLNKDHAANSTRVLRHFLCQIIA